MEQSYFYLMERLLLDRNMVNLIANILFPVLNSYVESEVLLNLLCDCNWL